MLINIRKVDEKLELITNGGPRETNMKGDFKNFGPVWYSPKSLASILFMAEVRKKCRITMNSNVEVSIVLHHKDGTKMEFVEYTSGLYYYDISICSHNYKEQPTDYCFVNTVSQNKLIFTRRDIEVADKAKELYALIGRTGQSKFERIVGNNEI